MQVWKPAIQQTWKSALRTAAFEVFAEAFGETLEGGRTVVLGQADFQKAVGFGVVLGGHEGFVELLFGVDEKSAAGAEDFGQAMVMPEGDVVVRAVLHVAFGA